MISSPIGRAMAIAVTRHNTNPSHLSERLADAEATIVELRALLRQRDATISTLHDQLSQIHADVLPPLHANGEGAGGGDLPGHAIDGRPVLTITEAAKAAGVSYISAWRYVDSGHWSARQDGSRWLVYADQPLSRKARR
jgi:hypothetical protein